MSAALNAHNDVLYVREAREQPASGTLPELAWVETIRPACTWDDVSMPVGSKGTVVSVLADGAAYHIEFPSPVGAIATMNRDDLREAEVAA